MGRKAEPGISFYYTPCTHVTSREVRLLFNEHGAEGFWVMQCLLAEIYRIAGYYFDYSDPEDLELFSTEICKKPVEYVQAVIDTCVKRKIFDPEIARDHLILTSEEIQHHYLTATYERRRKDTIIEIREELLLINLSLQKLPGKITIVPWNNLIVPRNNPHSIVEYSDSKGEDSKEGTTIVVPGAVPAEGGEQDLLSENVRKIYKEVKADPQLLYKFVREYRPAFIEPYVELWNYFAVKNKMAAVRAVTDARKKKFKIRIQEKAFDFLLILYKAAASETIRSGTWFAFDWILENQENYLKVIEGNYDNKTPINGNNQQTAATGTNSLDAMERLIEQKKVE